jgi:Uma2 family endonuclease
LHRSGEGVLGPLSGGPDLAIEILSPGQNARLFAEKIQFYLRHGIRLVWVVDPIDRVITVYRPEADARQLLPEDVLDGEDVLPRFAVAVADIFAQLDE